VFHEVSFVKTSVGILLFYTLLHFVCLYFRTRPCIHMLNSFCTFLSSYVQAHIYDLGFILKSSTRGARQNWIHENHNRPARLLGMTPAGQVLGAVGRWRKLLRSVQSMNRKEGKWRTLTKSTEIANATCSSVRCFLKFWYLKKKIIHNHSPSAPVPCDPGTISEVTTNVHPHQPS